MKAHACRISTAIFVGLGLVSLTGCSTDEVKIGHYANTVEAHGFEHATFIDEESNAVIFYYDAVVPCDAAGELPVRLRLDTDNDEPITWVEIFDQKHRILPSGKDVKDITVDDLRQSTDELKLTNCLSENA